MSDEPTLKSMTVCPFRTIEPERAVGL